MKNPSRATQNPYQIAREYLRHREAAESPALYYLSEIQELLKRTPGERIEIHRAKVLYPASRIVQDG